MEDVPPFMDSDQLAGGCKRLIHHVERNVDTAPRMQLTFISDHGRTLLTKYCMRVPGQLMINTALIFCNTTE
jgi:hypothetical protein